MPKPTVLARESTQNSTTFESQIAMKNPLYTCFFCLLGLISFGSVKAGASGYVRCHVQDSGIPVKKTWNKLTRQITLFSTASKAYVNTVLKVKPADSHATKDVVIYADSVNRVVKNTGPKDSHSVNRVQVLFDSLAEASTRLVRKIESDTSFKNNQAAQQLASTMSNIRGNVLQYRKDLNNSLSRKKAKQTATPPAQPAQEPANNNGKP